jgi:hypothetical protein
LNDLTALNDRLLTFDSQTNLEWLDVTRTVGVSFNDVSTKLSPGAALANFRYANGTEVHNLLLHAGVSTITNGAFLNTGDTANLLALVQLLGQTGFPSGGFPGPATRGIYADTVSIGSHLYASFGTNGNLTTVIVGESLGPAQFADNQTNIASGSFLVRNALATVPEPSSISLTLLALVSLLIGQKRRISERLSRAFFC